MSSKRTTIIAFVTTVIFYLVSSSIKLFGFLSSKDESLDVNNIKDSNELNNNPNVLWKEVDYFLNKNKDYNAKVQDNEGKEIKTGLIMIYPYCSYNKESFEEVKNKGKIDVDYDAKIKIFINKEPSISELVDICSKESSYFKIGKAILVLEIISFLFIVFIVVEICIIICGPLKNSNTPKIICYATTVPLLTCLIVLIIGIVASLNHYNLRGIEGNEAANKYGFYIPGINTIAVIGNSFSIVHYIVFITLMFIASKQREKEINPTSTKTTDTQQN